jgi:hypothetical protein
MRKFIRTALSALAGVLVTSAIVAATLTASINVNIVANYRGSNDLGAPSFSLTQSLQPSIALGTGTGSGQSDLMFSDTRTLAASGTENIDLAGSLTDAFGTTLTFVTIKVIKICAATANTNNVVVGGAATNTLLGVFSDATDKIAVKPQGCFIWVAPKVGATVTASTGDILLIANSAGSTGVTYDIIIIGTSA